ncbi:amidase [Enteractinococcus fodinae]|uniref:Aspartyl-tRNA(Asn)/glutamyl-tRNA(Gln) amidotransferase subunit A n=1 Tax=Enteractinococcus fodinae TaxID=684663 RepID=A0ABU2B374_9MICC|nr:amidase [Enteractinococcus fodinae]MDR7348040.1 aspartyl-tRNA(Asn)/glutamyl-tRNA(Gln) amidotransferase subunit A [Enteractinococcus fodinae]
MTDHRETLSTLGTKFRNGTTTAVEASRTARQAAKAAGPVFITVIDHDRAAQDSDALFSAGTPRSALEGIPIAVKDVIDTADMRTTMGSNVYADHQPEHDAAIVAQLRRAGANIIGKANTHEFSYGIRGDTSAFGVVPNPYDESRVSGGSSSGSAAAVAQGIVPVAIGTDTAGSTRVPAALCGVVGFKPTFDLLDTDGVFPLARSFDTVGLLGTTVRDVLATLDALGLEGFEPDAEDTEQFEFRMLQGNPGLSADAEIVSPEVPLPEVLDAPAIEHPTIRGEYADFRGLFNIVRSREAYLLHEPYLETYADQYQELTLTRLRNGRDISDADVDEAQASIDEVNQLYLDTFDDHQMLLTPTVPIDAPSQNEAPGEGSEVLVSQSVIWNMLGWPAVSIPYWIPGDPLPKGLQVIGKPGRDAAVLRAGQQLEQLLAERVETMRPAQPQATELYD